MHLGHEEDGVEHDEEEDEVLEGGGGDQAPDVEEEAGFRLGHVHFFGLGLDHVVDAGFLGR